jgi:hypothetical protein
MPAYVAKSAVGIYEGDVVVVFDQSKDGNAVTQCQSIAYTGTTGKENRISILNTSGQTVTVKQAATDTATTDYQPLTDADTNTAITCANNSGIVFTVTGPFIGFTFAAAPSAGKLTVMR